MKQFRLVETGQAVQSRSGRLVQVRLVEAGQVGRSRSGHSKQVRLVKAGQAGQSWSGRSNKVRLIKAGQASLIRQGILGKTLYTVELRDTHQEGKLTFKGHDFNS